jgi:hypothetical protein
VPIICARFRKVTKLLFFRHTDVIGGGMDEKISSLFQEWLSAFDAVQVASGEEAITRAHSRLSEIETQIANTSGEGMECLAIKLGLHCFLNEHSDAASLQSESAYRDLVRLISRNPAAEISDRLERHAKAASSARNKGGESQRSR